MSLLTSVNTLLIEFTEVLSVVCREFEQMVIQDDFNVHVDNGLCQYVSEPTHNRGHTLDRVITEGVNGASSYQVDKLLNYYTSSVLNVVDAIAPVKIKVIRKRQKALWRQCSFCHGTDTEVLEENGASQRLKLFM